VLPPVSLRPKIVLILTAVVLGYAALDHLFQRVTVSRSFAELEEDEARQDMERAAQAIQREIDHLDLSCRKWATWDDTCRFVQDEARLPALAGARAWAPLFGVPRAPIDAALAECARTRPAYERSNLGRETLLDGRVDVLYVCNRVGRVLWGDVHSPESGEALALLALPRGSLGARHPLLGRQLWACSRHPEQRRERAGACATCAEPLVANEELGPIRGLLMSEHGPILISSRQIYDSRGQGPSRGTLIMGRFLERTLVARLAESVGVRFEAWPLEGGSLPAEAGAVLDEVTAAPRPVVRARDARLLHVYTTFNDIQKAPALLIRADVDRAISGRGARSVRYALVSTIAAGLLLLLVLLGVLQKAVLKPIDRLTRHAVRIGQSDDVSTRLDLRRADEIGILSGEFDRMMEKLAVSRAAVVQTARAAGMSEIATGILHNVGNVLNSVNVSANLVAERVRGSKVAKLQRLTQLVEQHAGDLGALLATERGKNVGPYLVELSKLMAVEQESVLRETQSLSEGIEHIRRLVSAQQGYASRNGLREPTSIAEQIESAIQISAQACSGARGVEIERRIEELPAVRLDRHKLIEILVNVLKNARQAIEEAAPERPRIAVALRAEGGNARIEVQDNGVGIPAENLARVFNHGFTTKRDGHGFGLHASANAAKELGGSLSAHSGGPGRGATFVLEIPLGAAARAA
jgi:two-component system NtrC family sensor kinase